MSTIQLKTTIPGPNRRHSPSVVRARFREGSRSEHLFMWRRPKMPGSKTSMATAISTSLAALAVECRPPARTCRQCGQSATRSLSAYMRSGHALRELYPSRRAHESDHAGQVSQEDSICEQRRRGSRKCRKDCACAHRTVRDHRLRRRLPRPHHDDAGAYQQDPSL